jgi:NADH-quinone oxidoreductase subunit M
VLTLLLLVPIVTAVALLLGFGNRSWAKASASCQLALTLFLWLGYDQAAGGYQYVTASEPLFAGLDLRFALGVDGFSLLMLLLTGLVTVAAVWMSPKIDQRANLFDGLVLLISAGRMSSLCTPSTNWRLFQRSS